MLADYRKQQTDWIWREKSLGADNRQQQKDGGKVFLETDNEKHTIGDHFMLEQNVEEFWKLRSCSFKYLVTYFESCVYICEDFIWEFGLEIGLSHQTH